MKFDSFKRKFGIDPTTLDIGSIDRIISEKENGGVPLEIFRPDPTVCSNRGFVFGTTKVDAEKEVEAAMRLTAKRPLRNFFQLIFS